jgi:hypothetical protein
MLQMIVDIAWMLYLNRNLEIPMKKLFIIFMFLFPVLSFANTQYRVIPHNKHALIYVKFKDFQRLYDIGRGDGYVNIIPMTCKFTSLYDGKIYLSDGSNPDYMEKTKIRTYTKIKTLAVMPTEGLSINNLGCSTLEDGNKCIQAKKKQLDTLFINCYYDDDKH